MKRIVFGIALAIGLAFGGLEIARGAWLAREATRLYPATPVVQWSHEARRAIVPRGPNGIFGLENYGTKFPGEAAIYMAIVHAAVYDAALAIGGGYQPYAIALTAPAATSPEAAISTAAYRTLKGLDLDLSAEGEAILEKSYSDYIASVPAGPARDSGVAIGTQAANAVLALRQNDGREKKPVLGDLNPPPPGPGIWDEGSTPAVGLRVPGIRPLGLERAAQFRPDGPSPMASAEYASDFDEVKSLGRIDSTMRREEQRIQALFWTDHDLRQWNDAMLNLVRARDLDLVSAARMLVMAHVAGGDAMIACFDAKYTYWFWRPYQAIPHADQDPNPATVADTSWTPLRTTPNFPEYPSAHACHSTATAEALEEFFGTDRVTFTIDSRATQTTREFKRFHDAYKDVDWARVLVGFHFRNSDQEGSNLGRKVARFIFAHRFAPTR
jgi:hypothetical protein